MLGNSTLNILLNLSEMCYSFKYVLVTIVDKWKEYMDIDIETIRLC